jgi:hypothetical protein
MKVILRTIADASAQCAVERYAASRGPKTRRRHYRRYFDVVYAALHVLAERMPPARAAPSRS